MLDKLVYTVYAGTEELMQFNAPSAISGASSWNFLDLIGNLIKFVLGMTGAVAVIMIIIAGVRLIISGENEEAQKKAKSTIIWTSAGLVLIIASYTIVSWIVGPNSPLFSPNSQSI